METNLEQQSPKLNVTNVSSAVFGKEEGAALGGESSIGKLARILRTTRLKVNEVEKSITGISAKFLEIEKRITLNTENITGNIEKTASNTEKIKGNIEKTASNTEKIKGNIKKSETNAKKITSIKNILQNQKSNIGEKLPGNTEEKEKAKLNTTLTETNRILVEIQKQLAYDFAMRVAEDKQEVAEDKEATSKERFKREESALEKSAKAMVSTVKTATKKIVSPIGNIFQKLLAFIGILAKGIAVNAAFAWFQDPENQKKITKFFNILKENWKLLAKILLVIGSAILVGKIIGFVGAMAGLVSFVVGPFAGAIATALGAAALIGAIAYVASKQDLPDYLKKDVEEIEKMEGGVTPENRKKYAKKLEEAKKNLNPLQRFQGQGVRLDERIRFVTTGEYGFADEGLSKKFSFDAGLPFDINLMGNRQIDKDTLNRTGFINMPITTKSGDTIEQRYMGGPVMSGNTYLVGERGPELFSPNIDGSIVNNMRTEKIYQMLASGKRGRTRIVELPPQTIEGPKPEIKMPRGPATKAPKISSSNSLDGYRSVSSEIYGIMV